MSIKPARAWLPAGVLAGTGQGFREEFRAYEELGYEYNEFGVFTSEQGEVFTAVSSGCSCSAPWDNTDEGDLCKVGDFAGLRRKLSEWNGNPNSGHAPLSHGQLTEAYARLADLRLF